MFVCASFSIATTWNGLPCSSEPLPFSPLCGKHHFSALHCLNCTKFFPSTLSRILLSFSFLNSPAVSFRGILEEKCGVTSPLDWVPHTPAKDCVLCTPSQGWVSPSLPNGTTPRGQARIDTENISAWPSCSYSVGLTTVRSVTDGEADDSAGPIRNPSLRRERRSEAVSGH